MHDVVFGRLSMTEKFQSACMNKYEQMFIRCSCHKCLAPFFCPFFSACHPFGADKIQNEFEGFVCLFFCLLVFCLLV